MAAQGQNHRPPPQTLPLSQTPPAGDGSSWAPSPLLCLPHQHLEGGRTSHAPPHTLQGALIPIPTFTLALQEGAEPGSYHPSPPALQSQAHSPILHGDWSRARSLDSQPCSGHQAGLPHLQTPRALLRALILQPLQGEWSQA